MSNLSFFLGLYICGTVSSIAQYSGNLLISFSADLSDFAFAGRQNIL
jgi:hypothetical protein